MIIIVSSKTNATTIAEHLGQPEYSYHFVLKEFYPALQQLGTVKLVADPEHDVDAIHADAARRGETCVFLSFSPPHQTPLDLACPTVPIFAWEFDAIPDETWLGERFQDWRFVLNKLGRAITHSSFAVRTVQAAMGPDFPIASIPAPVWDRFAALGPEPNASSIAREVCPNNATEIFDSRSCELSSYSSPPPYRPDSTQRVRTISSRSSLKIDGIVYTSIFCPYDGRKNPFDMLRAFCCVFRDIADATLILKLTHHDNRYAVNLLLHEMYKLAPFQCRVLLIDGFLDDTDYENLLMATTYAVNASRGEGQCLPLMEYMSYGTPAIAPYHTGMTDYLCAENAFVIRSTAEPACWPHDPRAAYRTLARRIDFESLTQAYRDSYRIAKEAPDHYAAMARQARRALKQHCSSGMVLDRLREFLITPARPMRIDHSYGKILPRDATYRMGCTIDFSSGLDGRRYLVAGWDTIELGRGIWSNGQVAEMAFRMKPKARGPLFLCVNLSAFLAQTHADLEVDVAANGVALVRWRFSLSHPEGIDHCWREAVIPAEIASRDEICITFQIYQPISPEELGLSKDSRLLGIMLHELSISAVSRGLMGKVRPSVYSLSRPIDFAADPDARRYLLAGWDSIEPGRGIWSNGQVAEMAFRIKPKARGPLFLCVNLTAFLTQIHADLEVDVAANGVALVRWRFSLSHAEGIDHCWREAIIPAEIASRDEICIAFQINQPVSPKELGLSEDCRLLGIMLHELSISAVNRGFMGKIRPSVYSLSRPIDFAADPDARRYLLAGWSTTEHGRGVWSSGPLSEMAFRIEPKIRGSVGLRANVSAFLAAPHTELDVNVVANGLAIARWRFDLADADGIHHSWRDAIIPAKIAADDAIYITLQIEHPASPQELGLSEDCRLLGIMLHELSISPVQRPCPRRTSSHLRKVFAARFSPGRI